MSVSPTTVEECRRPGSIPDAGYILRTSGRTASREGLKTFRRTPGCALCCGEDKGGRRRQQRGRGAFSKRSHRGLGEVGVGSAGSVLKSERRSGGRGGRSALL